MRGTITFNLYQKILIFNPTSEYPNDLTNADYPSGTRLFELLIILTEFEPKIKFKNFEFLHNFIEDSLDEDTLKDLLNFIDEFNIDDEHILSTVENHIEVHLQDIADNNDLEIDFRNHINIYHNPEGYHDYDIDTAGIESEIYEN